MNILRIGLLIISITFLSCETLQSINERCAAISYVGVDEGIESGKFIDMRKNGNSNWYCAGRLYEKSEVRVGYVPGDKTKIYDLSYCDDVVGYKSSCEGENCISPLADDSAFNELVRQKFIQAGPPETH